MEIPRKVLRSVSYFVSNDETKQSLCFIHCYYNNNENKIKVEACNGNSAIIVSIESNQLEKEDLLIPVDDYLKLKGKRKESKNENLEIHKENNKTIINTKNETKSFLKTNNIEYPTISKLFSEAKENIKEYSPSQFSFNPELFCLLAKSFKELDNTKIKWEIPENTYNPIYFHQTLENENIKWEVILMPCYNSK